MWCHLVAAPHFPAMYSPCVVERPVTLHSSRDAYISHVKMTSILARHHMSCNFLIPPNAYAKTSIERRLEYYEPQFDRCEPSLLDIIFPNLLHTTEVD